MESMQPRSMLIRCLLLTSLLPWSATYEEFQMKIPNGNIVPFACKPSTFWRGVGHINNDGTGTRNPFGRDFEDAGYRWTRELCRKDSDGDGMYNGLELGDPDCVWSENGTAKTKEGLSHPGICDPWDSMFCGSRSIVSPIYPIQQTWLRDKCQSAGFDCPAMKDKDLMNVTARLSAGSQVPPQLTTYVCQIYSIYDLGIPKEMDYHMVAVTPKIDNNEVVHHIVLFGCTDAAVPTPQSFICGMKPSETCQEFMHVWTIGLSGECYHPESGIRIGKTGYKYIAVQAHWTNIRETPGIIDTSGLVLHFTPNLKSYDAGVFVLGSIQFYLPPKQQRYLVNSTCAGGCTKQLLTGSIFITAAWNHMHYTGKSMAIEVKRNNEHYTYLTMDRVYNYDSPQVMMFPKPVEIRPGDSIVTQCGYNTEDRNRTISYGDATLDEMCFGFITFYPRQSMTYPYCLDKLGISTCDPPSLGGCANIGLFLKMINATAAYADVTNNCRELAPCLQECVDTIIKHMKTEPCLRGSIWEFIQTELSMMKTSAGYNFLVRLASCKAQVQMIMNSRSVTDGAAVRAEKSYLAVVVLSSLVASLRLYRG